MEAEYKRLYSKGKDGGKLRGLGKYDKPDPHAMGIIYVVDEFNYQLDKDNYKEFIKFKEK